MAYNANEFVMTGLRDAIGKQPDWWVIDRAVIHQEKGNLTDTNLAELQARIESKNAVSEVSDETIEGESLESEVVNV